MKNDPQFKKALVTLNNPEKYGLNRDVTLEKLKSLPAYYGCYCEEMSASGTLHYHAFILFRSNMRFSTLKRKFPTAHIDQARGSVAENRDYITKSGKWANSEKADTVIEGSFFEWGEVPERSVMPAATSKAVDLLCKIKSGMSTMKIIESSPSYVFKSKEIDDLRERFLFEDNKAKMRPLTVNYLYGDTGSGKTRSIYKRHKAEDICRITSYSNSKAIFDSYRGNPVLVFEEFHSQIPITEMLCYLDVYPLRLPARYYERVACYNTVYITSNIPLSQQYINVQQTSMETWRALERRITNYIEFKSDGSRIIHKGADLFDNE